MSNYKVSIRYASSLLDNAIEKNNFDEISKDIELLESVIKGNIKLKLLLESPIIKPQLKFSIFEEIFGKRVNSETMNFIKFVIGKNRENMLYDITKEFLRLRDEYLNIINIEISSAYEFTGEQKNLLSEKFEKFLNKKVRFNFKMDKNIIGGFLAKFGDTIYDASIKRQLELLKKQFLSGATLN